MKGIKQLDKHYSNFTPEERFHLTLEALNRGDNDEVDRLRRTCPWKSYKMPDADYLDRAHMSMDITFIFSCFFLEMLDYVKVTHMGILAFELATMSIDRGFNAVMGTISKVPEKNSPIWHKLDEKYRKYDEMSQELQLVHKNNIIELKTLYEGFNRFCNHIGVEPIKMLSWYPPIISKIEAAAEFLHNENCPINEEKTKDYFEGFCHNWYPGKSKKQF